MADKEVLSQDEIDALLTQVDDDDLEADDALTVTDTEVRPYDLTSQDRVVRGRLPTLELLGEKFARQLRTNLQQLLRYSVEVGAGGVQILNYSEYAATLYVPTSITVVKINPLAGHAMVALDAKLVFRIVDQYFGGDGKNITVEGRDFTPTEQRVIDRVLEVIYRDMADAWSDVLAISMETIGREINPTLVNTFAEDDVMMVSTFHIELESGGGEIHVSIPYAALEPYRELLDTSVRIDESELDHDWLPALQRRLLGSEVPLRCAVATKQVKLRQLLGLQAGDVIDVDMPEFHLVLANEVPAFYAKLGESRGNLALEFQQDAPRG
ncbi:MAG: flagellar motor switch protein FliM [Gammaproteobacteria bacterium]|nr:flagellar motor switch protein FliM [Gammaproteobacteria bacterium]